MEELQAALAEIEQALPSVTWVADDVAAADTAGLVRLGARFWRGYANDWEFVLCSFSIEDQGFPPGTFGADGAARHTRRPLVVRLPRELAMRAWKRARAMPTMN